ncbi:MAG TPA: hypothetical protein VND97_01660 [Beijerinckiaceae bacterium]|nr:hypothetical protein [Beijerinckiaceae bacterium]
MNVDDPSTELPTARSLPSADPFQPGSSSSPASQARLDEVEGERNSVFTSLVTGDGDVVGLVAYSVYKQNKHDWLMAFGKAKGRDPDEAEVTAYIIGESTPRRLATYRHLAHATLEGKGPDVPVGAGGARAQRAVVAQPRRGAEGARPWATAIGYVVVAAVVAAAVLLAIRFGAIPSPH